MDQEREGGRVERLWDELWTETRLRQAEIHRAQTRLEDLSERFLGDLARLRAELAHLDDELAAGVRAERERLFREIEERAAAIASDALAWSVERAEARVRSGGGAAERDARERIGEVTRTALFRIETAGRAQRRESRIRAAVHRAEREMDDRVREAQRRLLDALERAARAEGPEPGPNPGGAV